MDRKLRIGRISMVGDWRIFAIVGEIEASQVFVNDDSTLLDTAATGDGSACESTTRTGGGLRYFCHV